MAVTEDRRFSSEIVSIDPLSLVSYTYSKNEIKLNKLEKSDKNAFYTSYLQTRDVISATIDVSRNIPDSDLKDAIEIKVYDELALDSAIEYSISYIETESKDSKNRSFNVFIIDAALIYTKLTPIKEKTRYIDYVTSAPFLIKALYRKNFIEADGTHCFVYFQKTDAFLAIYKNGEYVYSKSLHYSLKEINEKFCELIGERVDEEDFYKLLTNEGLRATNSQYQQSLMQLFGEIFLYINDVLVFTKRSYNIDFIDKIYLGSEIGTFSGIEEYGKSYLGLESYEFNFSIAINSKEWYIDQIHILMMLSAQLYIENPDDNLNFSIYKRPPPLKYRASGKFLGIMAASVIISLAYPAYQFAYHTFLSLIIVKQTSEYNELYKQTSDIRQQLSLLKTEKEKVDGLVKNETTKFEFRKKLLSEIYNKKISYPMKALMLLEIFQLSNQNGCKVEAIEFKNQQLDFFVRNKNEKKITEFIKDLTALKKYKVNTEKIIQDDKIKLYTSKISIGLSNE
ncbi:hypothetical protein FA592_13665 [Sulfurospirillum diekertiae]|uniref:Uncharacterized protein n=1 Tax=Sulfurospirillum diekertiae TaxID=1854492 RepID=A0A6G9VX17_9BACT|nr:hypothetical protein [Sulfurospirillum diekertiae]QIR77226.1 hypothetical protein FA584_13870 [Sulfurospirillum diekertiae]QIR79840.1 hypothetical protein FA592_13665 [Sulfurospirillum diekertiae]